MKPFRAMAPALAAVALVAQAGCGHNPPPCSQQHWVGAWMAAPSDPSPRLFSGQTLRMIIAPHLGGPQLRVRLTNRFATSPVTIGPVSIGRVAAAASLAPSTLRNVTFGHRKTVTIAPGADALSDPVALATSPFQDLAVSVFVPGSDVSASEHVVTRQISYLSPSGSGDQTASLAGRPFTRKTTTGNSTGWYFLDGLDVQAPAGTGAVVAFGDSLTDGLQPRPHGEQFANLNANTRYPDVLQRRLSASRIPLSTLNAGITANDLVQDSVYPIMTPAGIRRFRADALSQPGVTDVIAFEGINDIYFGATAEQLIAGYQKLISQAHRAGVKIQLATLTPVGGTAKAADVEPVRNAVNTWIRTQKLADGVIDFDHAIRDPGNTARIAPRYDASDHLHLDPDGNRALAGAVNLGQLTLPVCMR